MTIYASKCLFSVTYLIYHVYLRYHDNSICEKVMLSNKSCSQYLYFLGAHVPLSEVGTIVVDGILSSCYAGYHPYLANFATIPMQLFPNIMEWAFGDDVGFLVYAHMAHKLGTLLLPDGQLYGH